MASITANNPNLKSFIEIPQDHDFPIQNLPFGIFKNKDSAPRVGVAIGDYVLDCALLENLGFFSSTALGDTKVFAHAELNPFMALGRKVCREVRESISQLLRHDNSTLRDDNELRTKALLPMNQVELLMPVKIGAYTDFYSSKEHATNLGTMFRSKENPLLPNWVHIPVGYDGRASTIVVSDTNFHRPKGQLKPTEDEPPIYHASQRLDTELEMGFFVGTANDMGKPITIEKAAEHIFGMVLFNDWSARDIQKWEYVPLGPFLGKNFCSSISPWVVTMDALEPFRTAGPKQDPQPLPYLQNDRGWNFDVQLELQLQTPKLSQAETIARTNFKYMYWDCCQQLTHHTVNGCKMNTGDILASGTISGPSKDSCGSLIELTFGGKEPIRLSSGEERKFLQDGDSVVFKGWCQGDGYRIGFGEVRGTVLPAL